MLRMSSLRIMSSISVDKKAVGATYCRPYKLTKRLISISIYKKRKRNPMRSVMIQFAGQTFRRVSGPAGLRIRDRRSLQKNLRKVSISIIRGAVENPLAYCVDVVLCKFIGSFRHHFALAGIRCDNFDEEKAGIRASRLHTEKRGCVFFVGCTPNTH